MCQVGPNTLSTWGSFRSTGNPDGVVTASRKLPAGNGSVHDNTNTIFSSCSDTCVVIGVANCVAGNVAIGSSPAKLSKMFAKQNTKNFLSSSAFGVLMYMP